MLPDHTQGYVAHAPMEPHTALASVEGRRATVWASTQAPFGTQGLVAQALGLPLENVRIITPYLGAGFGGMGSSPQAVEADSLSKLAGKPVMLAWSREKEFFYDTIRMDVRQDSERPGLEDILRNRCGNLCGLHGGGRR